MQFKVTMQLSQGELGNVLAKFTKKQLADIKIVPTGNDSAESEEPDEILPDDIVMRSDLTGLPTPDKQQRAIKAHEQLEGKNGIGSVTRQALTDKVKKNISGHAGQVVSSLINQGWLVGVE